MSVYALWTQRPFEPMDLSYSITTIDGLFVVALSLLLGFEVIKNIPAVLHTPLMSGSNAISGIILIGGMIQLLNTTTDSPWIMAAACVAVLLGTINIAGGFFVTHRMLSMFGVRRKPKTGPRP